MNDLNAKQSSKSSSEELLTIQETCEFLKIKRRTLDDWRAAKAIPCIQRGRYIRFQRADLDDFLSRHRVTTKPASPYRPRGFSSKRPA